MQNNSFVGFSIKKQMASCPFNPSHIFQKQKLVFHISRCKDKQKRLPYMAKCKYNPMHYVEKLKLEEHQLFCKDRETHEQSISKHTINFRNSLRDHNNYPQNQQSSSQRNHYRERQNRSRSRQGKIEQSQVDKQVKQKFEDNNHKHSSDDQTFSDCQQCQTIIRRFKDKIMGNTKISKLIKKYQQVAGYSIL